MLDAQPFSLFLLFQHLYFLSEFLVRVPQVYNVPRSPITNGTKRMFHSGLLLLVRMQFTPAASF